MKKRPSELGLYNQINRYKEVGNLKRDKGEQRKSEGKREEEQKKKSRKTDPNIYK